ncbi:MotA/TolQ/ExbB proton channel family protein [Variovorax sp. dw_308]|uniref:MotA/TolQ/ExbB proton channel family protein n=1 Tax=Variovorax sp. dw_308 TaxID=2721546 RepID=UPI001C47EAFA|nr:MotA/TolQ/ExbB proton channel family protein [Variovorax sp. dw_308]
MTVLEQLTQGDGVSRGVAALLLAMSIGSWVVILWKTWFLRGGTRDLLRSVAAFWQAHTLTEALHHVKSFDRGMLVLPSVLALQGLASSPATKGSLGATGGRDAHLTRVLRVALHGTMRRVSAGQILLATVGATAPFVGLLGTVWGIYHALTGIAQSGAFTIDKVAGPVGEALIMTAAGLAVAIPAVLAYNWFGRVIGRIEAELEGFAHDLLAVFGERPEAGLPTAGTMLI